MHIRRKYKMKNSIEVVEFISAKCPGANRIRRPKEKPSSERIKKNNQKRKQRKAGRMGPGGLWRNIEVGPKNGWHIHVIVNRIEGAEFLIKDYWRQYGGVYFEYLQDKRDQGKDLGEYIAKSPITCERISDSSWSHSRNIQEVKGEDTVITGHAMTDKPRVPAGYYLDKDSVYDGFNEDGYPFRTYTVRRIQKKRIDHKLKPAQLRKLTKRKRKAKK